MATKTHEIPLVDIEPVSMPASLDLMRSIAHSGLKTPVWLRQNEIGVPYTILAGKRRIAALRALKGGCVDAYVVQAGNKPAEALLGLATNLTSSRNCGDEAKCIRVLVDQGWSEDEIVAAGIRRVLVRELITLQERLVPAAFEQLCMGLLSRTAAKRMAKLEPAAQMELVDGGEKVSQRDIESKLRLQGKRQLDTLDGLVLPQVLSTAHLSAQIDSVANSYSGKRRQVLLNAAQILLQKGDLK